MPEQCDISKHQLDAAGKVLHYGRNEEIQVEVPPPTSGVHWLILGQSLLLSQSDVVGKRAEDSNPSQVQVKLTHSAQPTSQNTPTHTPKKNLP